jgi:hypothetical protein
MPRRGAIDRPASASPTDRLRPFGEAGPRTLCPRSLRISCRFSPAVGIRSLPATACEAATGTPQPRSTFRNASRARPLDERDRDHYGGAGKSGDRFCFEAGAGIGARFCSRTSKGATPTSPLRGGRRSASVGSTNFGRGDAAPPRTAGQPACMMIEAAARDARLPG